MKSILLSLLTLTLYSCSYVFQYYKLSGEGEIKPHSENPNLLCSETDTLIICYSFWSEGGSILFEIYNRTEKDLYIDLSRSNLILNGQRIPYWEDIVQKNSSGSGIIIPLNIIPTIITSSSTSSVEWKPEKVVFLPSKSKFTFHKPISLFSTFILYNDSVVPTWTGRRIFNFIESFNPKNTPLSFRSNLYLSFNDDLKEHFKVDDKFYLNSIETIPKQNHIITNLPFERMDRTNLHNKFYRIYKTPDWYTVESSYKLSVKRTSSSEK